jgi:putative ABC transport system permease protein
LGLDFIALAISGLIYWLTASTGFSAVVNPDSNPTLSLAVYMFFAPALLWIGVTLLLVRLRGRLFGWLTRPLAAPRAGDWRSLLLASAGRRGAAINRGLILVGLLLAFGVSLGVFTATYDQQANVDAQLTIGGDVTVTAAPSAVTTRGLARKVASVRGVRAASALDHSARTSRTSTASTRRRSPRPRRCATPTSWADRPRRSCSGSTPAKLRSSSPRRRSPTTR